MAARRASACRPPGDVVPQGSRRDAGTTPAFDLARVVLPAGDMTAPVEIDPVALAGVTGGESQTERCTTLANAQAHINEGNRLLYHGGAPSRLQEDFDAEFDRCMKEPVTAPIGSTSTRRRGR